ncbi:MAG: hypothetical protein WDZ51_00680 [Pirellulaceae bacterium]
MKKMIRRAFVLTIGLVSLCGALGCGADDSGSRFQLSGTVTYEGKPVPFGRIDFVPDSTAGNSGPAGYADIVDGKYDTSKTGKGTSGGAYVANVSGSSAPPVVQTVGDEEFFKNPPAVTTSLFQNVRIKTDIPKETSTIDFEVPSAAN